MQRGAEDRYKLISNEGGPARQLETAYAGLRAIPEAETKEWTAMPPIGSWGEEVQDIFRAHAAELLADCSQRYLEVMLAPAPDPHYEGHCIRVATNRNPDWYRSLFCEGFKRRRFLRALEHVEAGTDKEAIPYERDHTYWTTCPPKKKLDRLIARLERQGLAPEFKKGKGRKDGLVRDLIGIPQRITVCRNGYQALAREEVFRQLTDGEALFEYFAPSLEVCLYFGRPTIEAEPRTQPAWDEEPEYEEEPAPFCQEFDETEIPF